MALAPVELGLIPIFVAILLGPLLVKRIEQNIETFLFLMGICAVAISRSWHIGLVEDAIQEPIIVGIVLSVLVAGLTAHYLGPHFLRGINDALLDEITMKVIFLEIVVVLGLSAIIITPILPFFLLVEVANHLPLTAQDTGKPYDNGKLIHMPRSCSGSGRDAALYDSHNENAGHSPFDKCLAIGTAKPIRNTMYTGARFDQRFLH